MTANPAFVPTQRLVITKLIDPDSAREAWHVSAIADQGFMVAAQGPSLLWCFLHLAPHIADLRSEFTLNGKN